MKISQLLLTRHSSGHGWYKLYIEKGPQSFKRCIPPSPYNWESCSIVRPKAFLEVSIDKEQIGRIVIELAHEVVPKTVENFMRLCNGVDKYCYKNTKIHRILKGVMLMGGDVENSDGSGSFSSFGKKYFEDENFIIPHSSAGLISMVSTGVNSNGSQFYISSSPTPHLNGRCMVFGRILSGMEVIKAIEKVYCVRGVPARDITISNCGII